MKPLLDTLCFAVWAVAYLGLACAVGRYRLARAYPPGGTGPGVHRLLADRLFHLSVFVLGLLLLAVVYLGVRTFGQAA